jgi:hypothetical protein
MLGQYVVGKPFDRELQKSLLALEEAAKLFELALHSDNRQVNILPRFGWAGSRRGFF